MTRVLPFLLLAALLAPTPAPGAPAPAAPAPDATARVAAASVELGGVTVRLRDRTRQVVTVNRRAGTHATVRFWAFRDGRWQERFRARDGRIGYGGLVRPSRRVQGSGTTPLGTFRLPWAFGQHRQRDAWDPSYRKIRRGDYWVLDNQSDFYNRWRNRSRGGFRWRLPVSHPDSSERLKDYPVQYEFAVTTSFNDGQVRHRGGAIFLHVNGDGATAGCVSAPRWFLRKVLLRLDPDHVPVIAIGR